MKIAFAGLTVVFACYMTTFAIGFIGLRLFGGNPELVFSLCLLGGTVLAILAGMIMRVLP